MSNYILWIGPLLKNSLTGDYKAVSPAANVWQHNFIDGLIENGYNVLSLSYIPEPAWPNGKLWVAGHDVEEKDAVEQKSVSYLNFYVVREIFIAAQLIFAFLKLRKSKFVCSFTYNPLLRHTITASFCKRFFRVKWVSVIADDVKKARPDHNLFLSYNYFSSTKEDSKIFCDGGVPQKEVIHKESHKDIKSLVYSGSITKWTGIFEFVEMYGNMVNDNFHFHIYGKGRNEELIELIKEKGFENITVHGFVDDQRLDEALKNAFVYINPRNTTLRNSENNFPSKLLLYLSHEKPVISTFSLGLSPQIKNVLLEYTDQYSLKENLVKLKNEEFYQEYVSKVTRYKQEHSWKNKTSRVMTVVNK